MMQALAQAPVPAPHADPLSIKGFLETSFVDWPGKVVSVLFLPRCNFRCPFCHNHSLVVNPAGYDDIPRPYIMARLTELKEWVDGVCISGGEPTIHPRLPSLMAEVKEVGLAVKLDTNGSRPDILQALLAQGLVDCVAMDIKAPLNEKYQEIVGMPVDLASTAETRCAPWLEYSKPPPMGLRSA